MNGDLFVTRKDQETITIQITRAIEDTWTVPSGAGATSCGRSPAGPENTSLDSEGRKALHYQR